MKHYLPCSLLLLPLLLWGGQMQSITDRYDKNDVSAINRNFSTVDTNITRHDKRILDLERYTNRGKVYIVPSPDSSTWFVVDVNGKVLETSQIASTTTALNASYVGSSTISVTSADNLAVGMAVFNQNAPITIPSGATIQSISGNIVTLSAPTISTTVYSGDVLKFITNPTWFTDTVTYAVEHGYALIALGQGAKNNDTVGPCQLIVTNAPVSVPASIFQYIDLSTVQLELIGNNGFVFDSAEYMEFKGPLVTAYHGSGSMYKWYAENQTPVDHLVGFSGNRYDFGALAYQGGDTSGGRVFDFWPGSGTISENRIVFKEIFGGLRALEGGGYLETPIIVNDPTASTYFRYNIIDGQHIHAFKNYAFSEGVAGTNQANINNNQWRIGKIAPAVGATTGTGFRTYGSYNTYITAVTNDEMGGNYEYGFAMQSGANYNRIYCNYVGATSGFVDNGTSNQFQYNGIITAKGNVGIGTTNPTDKLTIFTGAISTQIAVGYDSTAYYGIGRDSDTGYLRFNGMQGTSYSGLVFSINGVAYMEYAGPTDICWFRGNVSALSFTDRTPYPKDKEEAYRAVQSMIPKPGGGVDHNKMDKFILVKSTHTKINKKTKKKEVVTSVGRDLSATVSAQNEVIKDLIKRIEALEKK